MSYRGTSDEYRLGMFTEFFLTGYPLTAIVIVLMEFIYNGMFNCQAIIFFFLSFNPCPAE